MRANVRTGTAFVAALAVAALGGQSAQAQTDARQATEACRALPTEAERFTCMERLVFDLSSPTAESEPVPAAAVPAAAPQAAETPQVGDPVQAEGRRRLFGLPFTGGRENEDVVETSAAPEADSFGAERLAARNNEVQDQEVMAARVTSFEEAPYQRLRVTLDNGQVWEQREATPVWRLEQYGAPDEVEIFRSRFGGYRMRLVDKNLTLSVERVR